MTSLPKRPLPDLTPTERVARVVWRIGVEGHAMTTSEIADYSEITWDGAFKMMVRISRVLPIDVQNGRWQTGEIRWPY